MEITREQTKSLADLSPKIRENLGVGIGYAHPLAGSFITQDDEYIIFEPFDHNDDGIQLLHKNDTQVKYQGPIAIISKANYPEHDEKVENFLSLVDQAFLEGKIWYDPGINRIVNNIRYDIVKNEDHFFKVEIHSGDNNESFEVYVGSYNELVEALRYEKKTQIKSALKIIRETWPASIPSWVGRFKGFLIWALSFRWIFSKRPNVS